MDDLHWRARELFRDLGYLRGEAWCLSTLGDLARKEERLDDARAYYLEAQELFAQTSESSGLLWSLHDLAQVDRARGDLENASRGYRRTLQMAETTGHILMAPRFNLGILEITRGRYAQAEAVFSAILEDSLARGQEGHAAIARACLMPCLAARGAWDEWPGAPAPPESAPPRRGAPRPGHLRLGGGDGAHGPATPARTGRGDSRAPRAGLKLTPVIAHPRSVDALTRAWSLTSAAG